MESALRIGRDEAPLNFHIGLVFNDQLFGLRILASYHLELQRDYVTKENNRCHELKLWSLIFHMYVKRFMT